MRQLLPIGIGCHQHNSPLATNDCGAVITPDDEQVRSNHQGFLAIATMLARREVVFGMLIALVHANAGGRTCKNL